MNREELEIKPNKKNEEEIIESEEVKEEVVEEPKKDEVVNEQPTEDIQTIDLSIFNKKKFSINGDPSKIIELDVGDLNVLTRLQEQTPILDKLNDRVTKVKDKIKGLSDREILEVTANELKEIDSGMRKAIDTIFDAEVSKICVPSGSMYDPVAGGFKYEHLINTLVALYDKNISQEMKKIQNRLSKHTNKYTKKK